MKEKLKNLWWIWPMINTIAIILCFGCFDILRQADNQLQNNIESNTVEIEKIQYRLEKPDSVVVVNNIYVEKVKK